MEIITKQIETNQRVRILWNQFVLDEDFNVPDNKRDMKRIITSEGKVRIESVKSVENYVKVNGKLEFQVLYVGEGLEGTISSLEGKIPFEEMVYTENTSGDCEVRVLRVDLQASMIHSRKIRLKALLELEVETEKELVAKIPLDVEGENPLFKKKSELELLLLHTKKHDTYRIKEEITLPGTKETIGTILWTDISNRKLDTKLEEDDFATKFADALGTLGIQVIDDDGAVMGQADLQEFLHQSLSREE